MQCECPDSIAASLLDTLDVSNILPVSIVLDKVKQENGNLFLGYTFGYYKLTKEGNPYKHITYETHWIKCNYCPYCGEQLK